MYRGLFLKPIRTVALPNFRCLKSKDSDRPSAEDIVAHFRPDNRTFFLTTEAFKLLATLRTDLEKRITVVKEFYSAQSYMLTVRRSVAYGWIGDLWSKMIAAVKRKPRLMTIGICKVLLRMDQEFSGITTALEDVFGQLRNEIEQEYATFDKRYSTEAENVLNKITL